MARSRDHEGRIVRNSVQSPDPIPTGCTSPCWLWTARLHNNGYPVMNVWEDGRARKVYAHRVSYETFKGSIPEDHEVDHICVNKICVNPQHLQAVTPEVNKQLRDDRRRRAA